MKRLPSSLQSFSDDYPSSLREAPCNRDKSMPQAHVHLTNQFKPNDFQFCFAFHISFFFLQVKSWMIHDSYKHILVNSIMDDASWPHIFVVLWRETYNFCNYSDSV